MGESGKPTVFIAFSDLEDQIELASAADSKGTLLERKKKSQTSICASHLVTAVGFPCHFRSTFELRWPHVPSMKQILSEAGLGLIKFRTRKSLWLSWCKRPFLILDFLPSLLKSHRHVAMSQISFDVLMG